MKSDSVFLRHILDEAHFIIGEAVKNLSPGFRKKHSQIEWQKIAGMRDRLIHGYFDVDPAILWDVVRHRIPELRQQVEELLRVSGGPAPIDDEN